MKQIFSTIYSTFFVLILGYTLVSIQSHADFTYDGPTLKQLSDSISKNDYKPEDVPKMKTNLAYWFLVISFQSDKALMKEDEEVMKKTNEIYETCELLNDQDAINKRYTFRETVQNFKNNAINPAALDITKIEGYKQIKELDKKDPTKPLFYMDKDLTLSEGYVLGANILTATMMNKLSELKGPSVEETLGFINYHKQLTERNINFTDDVVKGMTELKNIIYGPDPDKEMTMRLSEISQQYQDYKQ